MRILFVVDDVLIILHQVSILGAVEDNNQTVFVRGRCRIHLDDIIVLAQYEPLEFVLTLLSDLGVAIWDIIGLGKYLVIQRVEHTLLHLDDSLNHKVFIDNENIAKASLASFAQAQEVIFFND
jgi:hypothetical protein